MTQMIDTPQGRRLAFHRSPGNGPWVVFLGGFKSDMQGTKALWLEGWARARGQAFVRFDYSGHGESSGDFQAGCISDWADDAQAAIEALTDGPVVLAGSSMGGWISLLLTRRIPKRIAGLVGIAAAPDFTKNGFDAGFTDAQRAEMTDTGRIALPSEYGEPYIITQRLIEDGARNLVLESPLLLPMPVRLLQGTADVDVPVDWALRLLNHAQGADIRLTLVKDADHRFSTPECLNLIGKTLAELPLIADPAHSS